MNPINLLLLAVPFAVAPQAAPPMSRPYLALFTFQNSRLEQLTDDQLRLLETSPYDGMAVWCLDTDSAAPPPDRDSLRPRLRHLRQRTRKHFWPFVFLSRMLQQEPKQPEARLDAVFSRIRGIDLDDETGSLTGFLVNWRRSLQIARELGSPGVGFDPEFYNSYHLEGLGLLAERRGEPLETTRRKLADVGHRMADIVREEFPEAVIWCLFTRLNRVQEGTALDPGTSAAPQAILIQGLLDRAQETRIPLTLIDGAENADAIGYLHPSLDALKTKLRTHSQQSQRWTARYPRLLLGGTIAPWLDTEHRADWMKEKPAVEKIEEFAPFFTILLQERPFVWIYGAGTAYNVWETAYADRFSPVLSAAKERARQRGDALQELPKGPPNG